MDKLNTVWGWVKSAGRYVRSRVEAYPVSAAIVAFLVGAFVF